MQYYYTIESKINLDKIQNECENLASRESPCKHDRSLQLHTTHFNQADLFRVMMSSNQGSVLAWDG